MELLSIAKDVKEGNLEKEEIPGFVVWMAGKLFWPFMLLILIGSCIFMVQ